MAELVAPLCCARWGEPRTTWPFSMPDQLSGSVLAPAAVTALAALALTGLARVLARRWRVLDQPDLARKTHAAPTPLLGGVAIYGAILLGCAAAWRSGAEWLADDAHVQNCVRMLLLSGGLFCAVGLWDDVCGLRPRTKFVLQAFAAVPYVVWGRAVESVQVLGTEVVLGSLGVGFTLFWLVACANIINLVDGMDGLAATIGLIVCGAIALRSGMDGVPGVLPLALLCAGALLGFLWHNWPPARIFLGDSGSLLVGFIVGVLSIEGSMKTATGFALAIPLVLVSVPVFDTFMAILRRKLQGRGIGEADRAHIHHCLQNRGLNRFQALAALAGLCLVMAAAAVVSAYFKNDLLALGLCTSVLTMLVVGRVFGYDETLLFFRYLRAVSAVLGETSGVLRARLLWARLEHVPPPPAGLWSEVTRAVERRGGTRLEFDARDCRDGTPLFQLIWAAPPEPPAALCADRTTSAAERPANSESPRRPGPSAADAQWRLEYSMPREEGVQLVVRASGIVPHAESPWRIDGLFQVLTMFCRQWPLPPRVAADDRSAAAALGPTVPLLDRAAGDWPQRREGRRAA